MMWIQRRIETKHSLHNVFILRFTKLKAHLYSVPFSRDMDMDTERVFMATAPAQLSTAN